MYSYDSSIKFFSSEVNIITDKRPKVTNIITDKRHNVTNTLSDKHHRITFVSYDFCRHMYVCRICYFLPYCIMFVTYDVCRIIRFVAY